ncbi:MAG: PAS domain S-box protein [Desulfobacteraceae bacterium]|nr:MAG: PAS domain S-box protein [Desulfobacteraceae bacterium]
MENRSRTNYELLEEISALKQQIKELEQSESERKLAEEAMRESEGRFRGMAGEMAVIAEISRVIGSTLKIDEVYERFATEAKKLISVDSLAINLYKYQNKTMRVAHVSGVSIDHRKQGDPLVLEGSLSEAVIRAQTGLRIQPANIDEIVSRFPRLFPIFHAGLRSIMCVPLVSRDEVIGVLHFRSKTPNAYTERDLGLAERIGAQIAGAIANAQLFSELKQAEEALERVHDELEQHVADRTEELMRVNEDLRTEITERKQAEAALRESEQNYRLLATYHKQLNDISIGFTAASSTEDLLNRIADSFRLLTGAIAATFSVYNNKTRDLKVVSLSTDPISSSKVESIFGPGLFEIRMPVSAEDMEHMLRQGVRRPKDLCELSFGIIPQDISDAVMNAVGCRQIIAIAISYAEELVGTCIAYLPGDQPVVPDDALKTYIYLSGLTVQRRWAEDALRESEEKYRLIAENTADLISVLDMNLRFTYVSPASMRLRGFTAEEAMQQSLEQVLTPEAMQLGLSVFEEEMQLEASGTPDPDRTRILELEEYKKDGSTIWVEVNLSFLRDKDRKPVGILIVSRDISERRRAEEELNKSKEQYRQAQKMEAIGQLAGGVAHDFNNMLNIILGYSQMALMKIEPTNPLRADIMEIMNAARRSADLVRQLLAFARKQTIAPKALDLNDTVAGMLNMLRKLIGENIDLLWMPAANLWPVKMDPAQIDQILANLTVNARDSIFGVGNITIETGKAEFNDAYCSKYTDFVPGQYVLLAVSDNGCGMDKETLEKIYEPFFTTKEIGKGTGMGLATVHGIVKQNNGFVNVYSEPGKGTTFKIYLPRHEEGEMKIDELYRQAGHLAGTETVLLVEDNEALLKMAKIMLEGLGYTVLAAGSPDEAVKLAEQYEGEVHLLVTDVVMPKMSGRDLQRRLSALRPDMKYLFMSGYTTNVIAHRGILDEGVNFLQKPFHMEELAAKLREALE